MKTRQAPGIILTTSYFYVQLIMIFLPLISLGVANSCFYFILVTVLHVYISTIGLWVTLILKNAADSDITECNYYDIKAPGV